MADVDDDAPVMSNGVGQDDEIEGDMENGVEEEGGKAPVNEEAWPDEVPKTQQLDEFERMEQEVMQEMEEKKKTDEEKKKKRRKESKDGEKKGKKKKKRGDSEKENKKAHVERDILAKHVGPRIRSFDAAKMKSKFQKPKEATQVPPECRICNKIVFAMEKIVAEKASWHKNCFRCMECNKNLTLETYQSNDGLLYCKPHFKNLFRPKAVVQDEAEERKDRQMRRPKLIVLESKPDILPDDVVRATSKPDYGLEELQQMNVRQRFAKFELLNQEEVRPPVSEPVKRSRSLMTKAARFLEGGEDKPYGVDNDELGEFDEEEEEEEEYEDEEEDEVEGEDGQMIVKSRKKKERPMSFSGMGDLKSAWEQKQRREEMSIARKEEISKFRMMLCAGKNMSLKEKFESGNFDEDDEDREAKSEIVIEGSRNKASNLRARFEQGEPFNQEEDGEERRSSIMGSEKQEVEEVFREAETAKKARNVFRNIDSHVSNEGNAVMRSSSFAANPGNRLSCDVSFLKNLQSPPIMGEVIKSAETKEDFSVETEDLSSRFNFFSTFEERKATEAKKKRKVFRITPPRDGADVKVDESVHAMAVKQSKPCMACSVCKLRGVSGGDETDVFGRDPNLIKCSDNYEDEVDCRNTKNILNMFKKMEMGQEDEDEDGPRPLKCFTPPPEDGREYSSSEYTDSEGEYTDDDDYDDDEEEDEEGGEEDPDRKAKFKDEILEMKTTPQSAKKAGQIRAKFERWEANQKNEKDGEEGEKGEDEDECRPSIDTARNLKAIFENKMAEDAKVHTSKQRSKVSRFV